jgi:hypothetical protein
VVHYSNSSSWHLILSLMLMLTCKGWLCYLGSHIHHHYHKCNHSHLKWWSCLCSIWREGHHCLIQVLGRREGCCECGFVNVGGVFSFFLSFFVRKGDAQLLDLYIYTCTCMADCLGCFSYLFLIKKYSCCFIHLNYGCLRVILVCFPTVIFQSSVVFGAGYHTSRVKKMPNKLQEL